MFQDPTAVAASGGTGITGWRVDGPLVGGGPPPGYAPTITTDPENSEYPMVGTAQGYTAGAATGNPTPTRSVKRLLDGVEIGGATSDDYTPVIGDVGGLLSIQETWTNSYGSASAVTRALLVTPEMAAATFIKYIDPTLAADEPGGPYTEGVTDYTPTFPLYDGSTAPTGKVYATCKAAYDSQSGDGIRYYLRKGYFHDPSSGVFFTSHFTRNDTLFSSYGPADADLPILDGVFYLDDATGWTPNGTITGAWDYNLTGVTDNNTDLKGRLWVGRTNEGDLVSQRPSGTGRRRATSLANLELATNGTHSSEDKGLWYITAGSPSKITVLSDASTEPPIYWGGIGLVIENFSSNPLRGISFRNGASNNRVEHLEVQGTNFKPLAIVGWSANGTCDSNAFVNVGVRSFIGNALNVEGSTASRVVTNTYVSTMTCLAQSGSLECETKAGTAYDWLNLNPWSFGGWVDTIYCQGLTYEGHNTHTVLEMTLLSNEPPSNVYIDGATITFLAGATDGRAGGGFINGGYFKNFTITNAPARTQFTGANFVISDGTVVDDGTNTNKEPANQFQAFKFTFTGVPTDTPPTENFSIHDVTFDISASTSMKAPFWFDGYDIVDDSLSATEIPDANSVEIYNCRAILSNTQGLVVRGTHPSSRPDAWPDQNIHDNEIVNASLIGQNYSTANSQSSSPSYTMQVLNGFFGASGNTVVAA